MISDMEALLIIHFSSVHRLCTLELRSKGLSELLNYGYVAKKLCAILQKGDTHAAR